MGTGCRVMGNTRLQLSTKKDIEGATAIGVRGMRHHDERDVGH